jgi:hypothetical protein
MRCFFDLVSAEESLSDTEGLEVADVQTIHMQAQDAIWELRLETETTPKEWEGWRLNVVGETGELLLSISLDTPSAAIVLPEDLQEPVSEQDIHPELITDRPALDKGERLH